MPFTEHAPCDLEVILRQHGAARATRETPWVKFLLDAAAGGGRLEVLALDAAAAAVADGVVRFVVVLLAVGFVVDDVEVGGGEGGGARAADEAVAVPAAGEAAVGGFDGFSGDGVVAASAGGFGDGGAAGFWFCVAWFGVGLERVRGWSL